MNTRGYILLLYSVAAALAVLSFGSCNSEKTTGGADAPALKPAVPLALSASIAGSGEAAETRANTYYEIGTNDWWSYVNFREGDQIGFFSQAGGGENGKESLDNILMTFVENTETEREPGQKAATRAVSWGIFRSEEVNISPSLISAQSTYTYFPYVKDVMTTGLELRRKDANPPKDPSTEDPSAGMLDSNYDYSNILKCVDFLTVDGLDFSNLEKDGMIYGEFYHAFSELIILRGEGFDKPKDNNFTIKVYLKEACTHLKITPEDATGTESWQCRLSLENTPSLATSTTDDYKAWQAWRGAQYSSTDKKYNGRDAWYVILPTIGTGNRRSTIDYIEIYDNDGHKQTVTSFKFKDPPMNTSNSYSKKLTAGWRYPFEISMQELVPTVNPFPIVRWEGDTDITDERPCGIHTRQQFDNWRNTYALYLKDKDDPELQESLLEYGNKEVDEQSGKLLCWHFYLMTDLDFSKDETPLTGPVIPRLEDVLDGESTDLSGSVFQNHTIAGLSEAFVGELSGNEAVLTNITLQSPEIRKLSTASAVGALVTTMRDGKIKNCNAINGTIISGGPVGMLVGSMSSGEISGCNMSGLLIGTETAANTAARIVGERSGGTVAADNNAASVVFN